MSTGLLFVTAPEADHKLINLMLLHIRDWEYGSGDRFKLVTTKNAYDLENAPATVPPSAAAAARQDETSPPLSSSLDNAWAGAALADVEAFCMDLMRDEENNQNNNNIHYNTTLYVVLDSTGAQARSCILGQRATNDPEEEEFAWLDRFDRMRVPWEDLYSPWCNLDIANMGFDDFTQEFDDGGEGGEDGWFTYKKIPGGVELSEDNRGRRDEEVRRFRDAGRI
jgi:hypothetical protein